MSLIAAAAFCLTACPARNSNDVGAENAGAVRIGMSYDEFKKAFPDSRPGNDEAEVGGKPGDPDLRVDVDESKITRIDVLSALYKAENGIAVGLSGREVEEKLGKPNATRAPKPGVLCAAWKSFPGRLVCLRTTATPPGSGMLPTEPEWASVSSEKVALISVVGR